MNLAFTKASREYGTSERVFEYRCVCTEQLFAGSGSQEEREQVMMEAMVLPNALCILVLPNVVIEGLRSAGSPIGSIAFHKNILGVPEDQEKLSKKKKGVKIAIKSPVCTITLENGTSMCLHSPVSGKVMELNQRLPASPDLLLSGFEGYAAVIQPDDKVANLIKLQS